MEVSIQVVMAQYENKILVLTRENVMLTAEKFALEEQIQALTNEAEALKAAKPAKEKKNDSKQMEK